MTATTPKLTEPETYTDWVVRAGTGHSASARAAHRDGWDAHAANSPLPECVAALEQLRRTLMDISWLAPNSAQRVHTDIAKADEALAAARAALSTEAQP